MAMKTEDKARQRALRANDGDVNKMKKDVELRVAPSARADAGVKVKAAEAALNELKAELKAKQEDYSQLDRASFGGRFRDMKLQGELAAIEYRKEKLQTDYTNALAAADKVEEEARATRRAYYRHKSGQAYLESLERKVRIEEALSRLEPLNDNIEIQAVIVEKRAQIRGIETLHLAALEEYADTYHLLTGTDIESEGVPSDAELNPPEPEVDPTRRGRPRNSRRMSQGGAYQ
jgi:chromosome segregation ATPase